MASQDLSITEVASRGDMTRFIRLPGELATGDPNWIEPLHFERRRFLNPKTNPFFDHADVKLWLATRQGKTVGRISAQIDHNMPLYEGEKVGMFGMLDGEDHDVISALLLSAEGWLREQGAKRVRGPFSLSINHSSGVLVDGFDTPPQVMMDHNGPQLGPAIERNGYVKARDLLAYHLDVSKGLSDKMRSLATRPFKGLNIRPLERKRFVEEIRTVMDIFNDAWGDNWGFVPLTEAETEAMAQELKPILPDEFVQIAEIDGEPVGFIVLLPNINEALRGLNGRLFPFGWARFLWRLKVTGFSSTRVPLMGVRKAAAKSMTGKLIPLQLIYALHEPSMSRGVKELEMSWLLEENTAVRRFVESIGSTVYKTYRVYEKQLT